MNVRDAFYEVLRAHGINTIFGNPGFTELPLLQDFPDDFQYILALQEGAAIAMADGFAQVTGRPALVNLHTAAGTGNAMGTLTASTAGHVPVVIASGQQARRNPAVNTFLTNVDASKLAEPLVKWSNEPARAQDVPLALSKAILLASAAPGPVNISLPLDDWDQEADVSALDHLTSRAVDGDPVVAEKSLSRLRDRLASATNPVMVAGPGIDTEAGWEGAIRLAEKLAMPVLVSPMPFRCPFPTRHPNFRAILPDDSVGVASHFAGHDLVIALGAAIFRYQVFTEGDQLPEGTDLWAVTSDPDEAARAPFGRILIGDPADAVARLAADMPATTRPPLPARASTPQPDTNGPGYTAEAIIDALDAAKSDGTVIAHEWSSAATKWDRFDFTRPGSMYFSASGTLGGGSRPRSACSSAIPPGACWRCSATGRCTTP
jgi:benzoylformate decarboxylase